MSTPNPATVTSAVSVERLISSRQMAWFRFRRNPAALIGAFIVLSVFIVAIFAPWLAPSPKSAGSHVDFANRHAAPSAQFWFGTDNVGRDIFSRVLYGYRISLGLVVGVLGVAVPFGVLLGLIAGYFGGRIEFFIMRLTDVMLAIPPLAMALAITAVLSPYCGGHGTHDSYIALSKVKWRKTT